MNERGLVTTCGDITVVTVTIPAAATLLSTLLGTLPAGRTKENILECIVLGSVTAGTSRGAFLFGGSDALGYCPEGIEKLFPSHAAQVYLKRPAASDVTAQVEVHWFP
jgi:hypothetical protein